VCAQFLYADARNQSATMFHKLSDQCDSFNPRSGGLRLYDFLLSLGMLGIQAGAPDKQVSLAPDIFLDANNRNSTDAIK